MSEQEILTEDENKAVDVVRVVMGVGGLVALVIGLLIVFNPLESGSVMMNILAVVLGCYLVIAGLVYLGAMMFTKTMSGWRRLGTALLGLLYLVAGVLVFVNLSSIATVLALFLSVFIGITWVVEGVLAFMSMGEARSKVWSLIYGLLSIVAGLILVIAPVLGAVTLWLLLGISMAVMGAVQMVRAFTLKP